MTSLQLNITASVARPQKSRRKDTQEATQNFILRIKSSWDEVDPSKHLLFLSFQIVQIQAKKDRRHMVFPLEVLIGLIHSWNKSGKDFGRTQQQLKSLRIEDHRALVILQ